MRKILVIAVLLITTPLFAKNWYDQLPNAFGGHSNFDPMYKIGQVDVNVLITSAQLKTSHTVPICILPVPDANHFYDVTDAVLFTQYDTNQFDANTASAIGLYYFDRTSTYTAATSTTTPSLLLGTTSTNRITTLTDAATNGEATLFENKGLYLYCTVGDPNGTVSKSRVNLVVHYSIQSTK